MAVGTEQRNSFYKLRSKIWECVDSVWLLVFLPLRVASRRERRSLTLLFSHSGSTASKEERMRRPTTRVEQSACLLYTKAYIPSFLALSLSFVFFFFFLPLFAPVSMYISSRPEPTRREQQSASGIYKKGKGKAKENKKGQKKHCKRRCV